MGIVIDTYDVVRSHSSHVLLTKVRGDPDGSLSLSASRHATGIFLDESRTHETDHV